MDRYRNEIWPFFFLPIFFVLFLGSFVLQAATGQWWGTIIGLLAACGVIILVYGGHAFLVTRNLALDEEIHQPLGHEVSSPPSSWCLATSKP